MPPGAAQQGLTAYSVRHFKRLTQLMRSTYLLDHLLGGMNSLLPEHEGTWLAQVGLRARLPSGAGGIAAAEPGKQCMCLVQETKASGHQRQCAARARM